MSIEVTGLKGISFLIDEIVSDGVLQKMLDAGGDSFVDDTRDFIDAGKSFTSRSGHLFDSIVAEELGDGILASAQAFSPKTKVGRGGIDYAPLVEFGKNKHPFFFEDMENRKENMVIAMQSVLDEVIK